MYLIYNMSKKTQKRNRRRIKKKTLKRKKYIKKSINRYKRGGENEKVTCCMCEREVDKNNTLIPRECLKKNGFAAHRICHNCWWNPVSGFAREDVSHKCPGCIKNLPLTQVKSKESEVVNLTLDDD
jgi:hypothetical protein